MLKKLQLFLLVSLLMPVALKAEWIPLDNTKTAKTPPKVTLLSDDANSSVIRIELSGFDLKEFKSGRTTYQAVDLLTEVFMTEAGLPELPYIAKILAVPDQASVSVEVLETGKVNTFKDIYLAPARASWYEGTPEPSYAENADAYRSDDVYPGESASIEPPSVFRDFRITRVSVFPVRYISATRELQVVSSITVRINYGTGKAVNPRTTANRGIAPSFAKLYRSFIFNYQEVLNRQYGGSEDGRELILCIMPDEFFNSFQVYADWKRQSGTDVHVTKFIEIGGNTNNPDVIKAYIADAYHNWEYPPTYVLMVGDDGVFPKKIVTYPDYSFPNEDYFVEIDGSDYFPEMMIGRFTNQGDYRMQVMIYKFMLYEKTPDLTNTSWYKKGTVCSNNAYVSQIETKRFAASRMRQYGAFTTVDTLMSDGDYWGGNCTVDLDDVISAINNGRSYLNYRGEGWSDGWHASCYYFHTSDVSALNNGLKFTFVTSIGCGVAMFDAGGGGNCFGEEWVEMGSLTEPRGACAFVGPTSNTHTAYNNSIDRGIYTGMFQEGLDTPGQALLRGKLYMYNTFGGDYYTEYHFKIYCCLGDPSIHIWKDIPLMVNVDHPSSILVGPNQLEITVNYASSGNPAQNAEVCLSGDDTFNTAVTDSEGKVYIDIEPLLADTLKLTVRGGNVFPYQADIEVIQPAELVVPEGDPYIVDLDGNLDGRINPNEDCAVTYTLKNWGSQIATNVTATLTSPDVEYVQIITTEPVSFGNMAPGGVVTGNPFQIYIKPECPVGQVIQLQLHVSSSDYNWEYSDNALVKGCELVVYNFMVNDAGSANENYRMDPGETVMLFIASLNEGEDVAPNVSGILSSNDPYITIIDSTGYFGTINIGDVKLTAPSYYVVSVDAACPTEYLAEYSLKLTTQNGNYPYKTAPTFTIPVSLPIPSDYTGPDAYGYYAYSSDDYYDQAPDYNWFEINGLGNELNIPFQVGNYTETVSLPFAFKYYGINYNQLRISTDGWIAFGSGTQTAPVNAPLPNSDNINCMVAGFWDDLYDTATMEGNILYYHDAANHRYMIEWDSIARNDFGTEPNFEVFQIILMDPVFYPTATGDGEIIIQYKKAAGTLSNTVGIENHTVNIGLQYVYNDDYDPTATGLMNQFAIKFTTEPPFASIITRIGEGGTALSPDGYGLDQNSPNPFISDTRINYVIPEHCQVSLVVYNINGSLVRTLQTGTQQAGSYSVAWDGKNDAGNAVSSGVYFYQLKTQEYESTRKMFILR